MNKRHTRQRQRSDRRLGYSIARLAKMTDLSRSSLYEEIAAGRLVGRKASRRTIITRRDAVRWLQSLPLMGADVPPDRQSMTPIPNSPDTQEA